MVRDSVVQKKVLCHKFTKLFEIINHFRRKLFRNGSIGGVNPLILWRIFLLNSYCRSKIFINFAIE
jgi:hypothetical protein